MQLSNINDILRRKLSVQSVQDVDGFPCSNYAEFLQRQEEGRLEVLTGYDSAVLPALGTSGERAMHYALTWSPAWIGVALIALSLIWSNFWLLFGIPLAFLGFLFSTPAFMKTLGGSVLLGAVVLAVFALFRGNYTSALLAGAYGVSNYLTSVARTQCDMIVRRAIQNSELVLVWLYLKRTVVIVPKGSDA